MLISILSSYVIHHSFTFSQHFLYLYTVSVAFCPLLQCVGAGNVWKGQHKETEEKEEIWHSNLSQCYVPSVHYAIISWNVNSTTPTRQTILSEFINFRDLFEKNLAPADVMRLAAPPGQRVYGRERARRRQSWQQEGEGSHKVATQSRRLACLSRVNIGPRLHTVMTNTGGRAQKHYQDNTLSWQTPHMPFLSSFCLCFLQNKHRALTSKALA